jgi:FkbM family methyltransferase
LGLFKSLQKKSRAFCFNRLLENVKAKKLRPFSVNEQGIWFNTAYGFSIYSNMKDKILKLDVNPVWAQIESSFILANVTKGNFFIDVGANIGYFSLLAAHQCKASVLAIEPIPKTYEMLTMNIEHNELRELIEPVNVALGNEESVIRFTASLGPKNHAEYEVNNIHSKYPTIEVPVTTLDNLLRCKKACQKIDFIKVDIEGFEYRFLQGAVQTIKDFRPILLMEIVGHRLVKYGAAAQKVFVFMKDLGYDYLCITQNSIRNHGNWQEDLMQGSNFIFYSHDRVPVY